MKVLVIGSGGREHALVWKLKQSPTVRDIFVAPGNAGTAQMATNLLLSTTNEIVDWLKKNRADLVVVGPDNYLEEGIVDKIKELGIPVFGPTKAAAEIEWSKSFAKQFMKEEGIPTASFHVFSDYKKASEYIKTQKFPLVIKANGLALGKGVVVAHNLSEAEQALKKMMNEKIFGSAGAEVVIEEYLQGREISIHAFCDGETAVLFPAAEDHKRIFDGDQGPNTGGMGTITPVPWVSKEMIEEIERKIVKPTIQALKKHGRLFQGILFPGVMITDEGPKVIEFNARFGDPETEVYMRILETDLVEILLACINGTLKKQKITWSEKSACCVVCASGGYPGKYETGKTISGLDTIHNKSVVVFHAGTKMDGNKAVTNGGRVLGVTAVGKNLKTALSKSYNAIKSVSFEGMQYRKDIGKKSL